MQSAINLKNQNRLLTLASLLFLLLSLLLGLKLVSERQLINKQAATPAGTIYMSLANDTSVQVGQTLSVPIKFQSVTTPDNKGISGVYLTLKYPNTAAFSQPAIQENLPSPWKYTFKQVTPGTSDTTVYIEAVYDLVGTQGYTPSVNETFATLNFPAVAPGTLTLNLDPNLNVSQAISKSTLVDILNSSLASATYTVTETVTATPTPVPASVSITDFAFTPQNLTITVGDTVTWANNSSSPHTVTSNSGLWDSGNLNPGQVYSRTFTAAGTFPYHCSIHPAMTGTITVLASPTLTPTPVVAATNTPPPGSAEPNNCGGTCGSNYNCQGGLACFYDPNLKQKYCRNPLDPQSLDCTIRPATPTPTRRPARTTPRPSSTPTPTFIPYEEISPTPTIELLPPDEEYTPPAEEEPTPPQSPFLTRILIIGGTWLLVFLLIIWLIKKYLDSRAKDKTVSDLVNRFKTPEPPAAPPTPPTPPAVP